MLSRLICDRFSVNFGKFGLILVQCRFMDLYLYKADVSGVSMMGSWGVVVPFRCYVIYLHLIGGICVAWRILTFI